MATTTKDVSDNPTGNAVTSPTDAKAKEADIDRKMRFYGVIEAFRQGKLPSNAQIDHTLKYVRSNAPFDESELSSDGKQLVQDVRDIIETAGLMVKEKNEGELFQNFIYHTTRVDGQGHLENVKGLANAGPSAEDAKSDGQEAAENLRVLAKLIYTSSETRKLLKDIGILARDVAADGAIKVAETARPAEHQLNQIDETAPHNEWIGPNGEKYSHNDPAPDTGLAAKRDQARDYQSQASSAMDQVKAEGADVAQTAQAHGQDTAQRADAAQASQGGTRQDRADAAKREAQVAGNEKADVASDVANQKADKAKGAYGNLAAKIPEEHKERARQAHADAKDYFNEKIPQERRDRFIYRLKKVIVEQQRHRDYQDAIEFFLGLAETYHGHAKGVTGDAGNKAGDFRSDPSYQRAEREMRTLLERFANGASMQPMIDAVNQIYVDAQNDEGLRGWFSKLDSYVRRVLQEPGFVMEEECDAEGRAIREDGKQYWTEKYAGHRETLFNEIQNFFTSYADDPLNVRFGENWKALTKDLFLNAEGNLELKPHLWQDIAQVIAPQIFKKAGALPLPRIEYSDNQVDIVIENLTLEASNILPNVVELEIKNYFKLSAYNKIRNRNRHTFFLSFAQIQSDLRDVAFYVHKKSGFPKLKDSGVADVVISGNGISGHVELETSESKDRVFVVKSVKAKVDKLSFAIRQSKHNVLYSTFRPLATSLIKKQVAKAIEDGIRSGLEQLEAQLIDIRERIDSQEGVSKVDAVKSTFQKKKAEAAETKSKAEPKGQFQITAKRESRIVDWSSPNSIVEKQAERFEAIGKSDGSQDWHSKAFDIV